MEEQHTINFTGWKCDLTKILRRGYKIDRTSPCRVSPVGEIRCKLIKCKEEK